MNRQQQMIGELKKVSLPNLNGNRSGRETILLLLNFNAPDLSEYLRITGEDSLTRVYPYNERPMQCKNCQRYGHTKNKCTSSVTICGWCAGQYPTAECNREITPASCINCKQPHATTTEECPTDRRR